MKNRPISRRGFLRLCAMTAAGFAAAACGNARPKPAETLESSQTPGSAATPGPVVLGETQPPPTDTAIPPTPTEEIVAQITLHGNEFDAWTWRKTVTGKVIGLPEGSTVRVVANGSEYAARVDGERFTAEIGVEEGNNYVFAYFQGPGGEQVRSAEVNVVGRLRRVPAARVAPALESGRLILDGAPSEPSSPTAALLEWIWSARVDNPGPVKVDAAGLAGGSDLSGEVEFTGEVKGSRIRVVLPPVDGEYYFTLRVKDSTGAQDASTIYVVVENGAPRLPDLATENTAWVEHAVVYGVIPRNFGSPAFQAITARLDDLADLGITAIWLAPVNVSPPGDYGYAVVDYFNLNPTYGTKEDFRRMIQEAHARGIHVMMDLVPNHSSAKHPYFLDALENGPDSPYWNFYDRDAEGNPTHYFHWTHLPNLNYSNPEVERWILEASSYWVREFDVDGYRVDACWGVKERKPDFWPKWRQELKRIRPDLFLLAEASARDPYYFDHGFDAGYDWTDELGKWAWTPVFDSYRHRLLVYNLEVALTNRPTGFHPDALIFRFLNNNDTGDRFITTHGEPFTRVATALLLTLPGIPCIYTGDEVGLEFRPYQNPEPLTWDESRYPGLRDYHKKLIALRKEVPALGSRQWLPLEVTPKPDQIVFAFARFVGEYEQPVLVCLNFAETTAEAEVKLPEALQALAEAGPLTDLITGQVVASLAPGSLRLPLSGHTAMILTRRPQDR